MIPEDIDRGWLTIAASPKRDLKRAGGTTRDGRTPLGDKGLGRLGTQRLGSRIHIVTRPVNEAISTRTQKLADTEHEVLFSWDDFREGVSVSEVPVQRDERSLSGPAPSGTVLTIRDLRAPEHWSEGSSRKRLREQLAVLISPYDLIRDFSVSVMVDGERVELAEVTREVRQAAEVTYRFVFDGERLDVDGRLKLTYFRPGPDLRTAFREVVESDRGAGLLRHLQEHPPSARFAPEPDVGGPWFVRVRWSVSLAEFGGLALTPDGTPASPGPFDGEIDYFSFDSESHRQQSVFEALDAYKKFVQSLSGIRVYRDGFGVRLDRDWLGLSKAWTGGGSWYTLRPRNTLGYVAITAGGNPQLEEKTDREGFTDNAHFTNLKALLSSALIENANRAQGELKRGAIQYLKDHSQRSLDPSQDAGPQSVVAQLVHAAEHQAVLQARFRDRLEHAAAGSSVATHDAAREVRDAIPDLDGIADLQRRATGAARVLAAQLDQLTSQVDELYELASLGLAAEALSHEIQFVADRLAEAARRASADLKQGEVSRAQLRTFVEHVHTSIGALRKQLSYLAPALRYVRENRERVVVGDFLLKGPFGEHQRTRLGRSGIDYVVDVGLLGDFDVWLNPGKLTQVFDNLVRNSEYWIREALRQRQIAHGQVSIEIRKPSVRVADNGPGVPQSVEDSVFEPFVTTKARGEGRGLGLFIAKQLLATEGCVIELLPERNEHGRRYKFEVNLGGALHGNERD